MTEVEYKITTKTNKDYAKGATDATVFILLIGNQGRSTTSWIELDNFFRDDFEQGRVDDFTVKGKDVGLPEVIRLRLDKNKDKDGWLVDSVTIKTEKSGEAHFIIYDIIMDEIAARTGGASLPQNDTSLLHRDIRQLEIARNKFMYRWHVLPSIDQVGWDLPRFGPAEEFEELPLLFQANDLRQEDFEGHRTNVKLNVLMEYGKGLFVNNQPENFDDFKKVFHHPEISDEMPPFLDCWKTDEEMGRQMLNGVNPTIISRCDELPKELKHAEEQIFGDLTTCAQAIKAKRLYYVNYRDSLKGLGRNHNKSGDILYCAESICVFQVGKDKLIRPIAIQLEENGPVFTPKDSEHDWLLAKLYFRNTDVNLHEYQAHLLRTHIMMEPITIGMFQSLSRNHPIYKLLRPHTQTVAAINTLGRNFLIGADAPASFTLSMNGLDMIRADFRKVTFDDLNIPLLLKKRGTDDPEALPYFHYREDALMLWDTIKKYINSVVTAFYTCDQDVEKDTELTQFIRTVAEDGIGWAGDGTKGFPSKLSGIDDLVHYCTVCLFTSSVQHAASNFGQFEMYKFTPNSPAGMRMPPHKKGEATMDRIMRSMPDAIMAALQVGISYTLSAFSPNEIYLGDYPMQLFTEQSVLAAQAEFRKDLKRISEKIHKRNKELLPMIPYVFLLPERIPNSIAV